MLTAAAAAVLRCVAGRWGPWQLRRTATQWSFSAGSFTVCVRREWRVACTLWTASRVNPREPPNPSPSSPSSRDNPNALNQQELNRNPPDGVSVGLADDSDLFKWEVRLPSLALAAPRPLYPSPTCDAWPTHASHPPRSPAAHDRGTPGHPVRGWLLQGDPRLSPGLSQHASPGISIPAPAPSFPPPFTCLALASHQQLVFAPPRGLQMTFTSPMWHPNVYPDGKVCISVRDPLTMPWVGPGSPPQP